MLCVVFIADIISSQAVGANLDFPGRLFWRWNVTRGRKTALLRLRWRYLLTSLWNSPCVDEPREIIRRIHGDFFSRHSDGDCRKLLLTKPKD
ncbi:hypothetical protein B296_00003741 [Ensete ventricosum]|uniref:Secreted protein n=1 Tax=Ensete ventricosum TaxID=4639 RepID=A0A427A9N5_ENSVE|nr:hypothetical protein B296_00003741 [Ensete ventricosum]